MNGWRVVIEITIDESKGLQPLVLPVLLPHNYAPICHPREGGDPLYLYKWIPFLPGMTISNTFRVREPAAPYISSAILLYSISASGRYFISLRFSFSLILSPSELIYSAAKTSDKDASLFKVIIP